MKAGELVQSMIFETPIPSVFPSQIRPGAVVGSLRPETNERRFDQRALLRWADDGGRWAGEVNFTS
jgi:hypothetical protein